MKEAMMSIKRTFLSLKKGDEKALAQMLTWIEQVGVEALSLCPGLWKSDKKSFRVGLTGPPGAGKSTLLSGLIYELGVKKKLKVGVLAVDPSSPFTKGAILADRLRFQKQITESGVFARSVGTRGAEGGLSASVHLMLRAFDWFGFDLVLIETVGVGQTQWDVLGVSDLVTVILTPESGDSIQVMKSGLFEVADLFVINKSDRSGAWSLSQELEEQLKKQVLLTVATKGEGIKELAEVFLKKKETSDFVKNRSKNLKIEAATLCKSYLEQKVLKQIEGLETEEQILSLLMSLDFKSINDGLDS